MATTRLEVFVAEACISLFFLLVVLSTRSLGSVCMSGTLVFSASQITIATMLPQIPSRHCQKLLKRILRHLVCEIVLNEQMFACCIAGGWNERLATWSSAAAGTFHHKSAQTFTTKVPLLARRCFQFSCLHNAPKEFIWSVLSYNTWCKFTRILLISRSHKKKRENFSCSTHMDHQGNSLCMDFLRVAKARSPS